LSRACRAWHRRRLGRPRQTWRSSSCASARIRLTSPPAERRATRRLRPSVQERPSCRGRERVGSPSFALR
jgi:hypothetical protein